MDGQTPIQWIFAVGWLQRLRSGACPAIRQRRNLGTAIVWVRRLRETGSVAPGQIGGHKPRAISGEYRA